MTLKIDHIAFQVADLEVSLKFYQQTLGLKLLSKTVDEEHGEAFAFLEMEDGALELLQPLQQAKGRRPKIKPPYCPHLAIQAKDLEQFALSLQQKGVPLIKGPLEIPGMVKWLYIADPDHNIIEFVQWLQPPARS